MRKKLLAFAAVMVLLIAALCANALAAEVVDSGKCGENVTWTLDSDGLLTISGTGEMENWDWRDNHAPWYENRSSIQSITISDSVTSIGNYAFSSCTSLTSVTIPNSVTMIGGSAFGDCTSLTSVTIPNSVTTIDYGAFFGCTSLTSVMIPDSVTAIGEHAFYGCESLTSVMIPNSVTAINGFAFRYCTSLTSMMIPDSVTAIGEHAFYGCESLTSVTIPDSVTTIGECTFSGCTSLTSVSIPDSVTEIGYCAFARCTSLERIYVDEKNEYYSCDERGILYGKEKTRLIMAPALTELNISDGVITLETTATSNCTSLKCIVFPVSIKKIEKHNISFPQTVETIVFKGNAPAVEVIDHGRGSVPPVRRNAVRKENETTIIAYYPIDNSTWNKANREKISSCFYDDITWITYDPANPPFEPTHPAGDIDGNGQVENSDLVTIARYIVGLTEGDTKSAVEAYADMNSDGKVDNADIVTVARIIVGLA